MFHDISTDMRQVMRALEEQVARDQPSLRSVSEDVGRCLSLLAMSAPPGAFLELGSSGGYSSLWLSLAAQVKGVKLTTVDLSEKKVALAKENISRAGAAGSVEVFHGDAFDFATRSDAGVLLLRHRAPGVKRQDLRVRRPAPGARRLAGGR